MSVSRMNRRHFLQTAAATTLGGALAACGGAPATSSSSVVTVTYWDLLVSQAPYIDNEIKLFEQAHPNIKIKKTTNLYNTYDNLLTLAFKSGNQPDVFMTSTGSVPLNQQVKNGWLLPLDKLADNWKSRFPANSFAEGANMFSGHIYTAPFSGHAPWLQLYIHNGLFKDAGITNADGSVKLPKTWDDVTHAAEAITKKGNGNVYGIGFGGGGGGDPQARMLELFVRGAGSPGGAYDKDLRVGKYTQGTDRNYMDFITLMLDWKQKGYFYPTSASISDEVSRAYFEKAKYGMLPGGVWNQVEWTQHGFTDYSLVTLVPPTETPKAYFYYSSSGNSMWAASAKTKHLDETQAWLDWLYSPEAGQRWTQQFNEDLSTYPQNNDPAKIKFVPFAQYVATTSDIRLGPDPYIRNPQNAQVVINSVSPNIGDVMTGIYTGQIKQSDIASTLLATQQRYQKALDDGINQAMQKGVKVSPDDWAFSDWDPTQDYVTKLKTS